MANFKKRQSAEIFRDKNIYLLNKKIIYKFDSSMQFEVVEIEILEHILTSTQEQIYTVYCVCLDNKKKKDYTFLDISYLLNSFEII